MHDFSFVEAANGNAVFQCKICSHILQFNLPNVGTPSAVDNLNGTWSTPPNPDQWTAPCTS